MQLFVFYLSPVIQALCFLLFLLLLSSLLVVVTVVIVEVVVLLLLLKYFQCTLSHAESESEAQENCESENK